MTLRYLLDTNVLSDLIRRQQGRVAEGIGTVGESTVCTSVIVTTELRFGAAKAGSEKLSERVDLVLSALEVLPLVLPSDRSYADILWHLSQRAHPSGPTTS